MEKKKVVKKTTSEKPKNKKRSRAPKPYQLSDILKWKAPDYYQFEKSPFWSFAVGIIAVGLSLILIYTQNYFPVVIIMLGVIVTFQLAHEKPKTVEFALDEGGILSRNTYVPYSELKSFWIARHGSRHILYLEPISIIKGPIVIPLGNMHIGDVKFFLMRFLPEKREYGEMFSEKLMRIFKL